MRSIISNLKGALASAVLLAVAVLAAAPEVAAQGDEIVVGGDPKVSIQVQTPGTLAELLAPAQERVRELTVTGTINAADFAPMWSATYYNLLETIDLSGATIEGNMIPANAFYHPEESEVEPKLRKIVLPEGITTIGDAAFSFCRKLEFNLPQSLEHIGKYSFYENRGIRNLEFPPGLKTIGEAAFHWTRLEHIVLPEELESIDVQAFSNSNLLEVTVPGNCKLGRGVFSSCQILEKVVLEEGITELPDFMFSDCAKLAQIEWPTTIKTIGVCAMMTLPNMPEILLPEGVECIEELGLHNCFFTKVFSLPSTLSYLGPRVFLDCSSTEAIYCQALTPPECGVDPNDGSTPFKDSYGHQVPATATLYVPVGTAELYRAAPGWDYFQNVVETDQFPQAGLEQATVAQPAEADAPVYNLQGMRVTNPQRGHLYIIGGRKVVY